MDNTRITQMFRNITGVPEGVTKYSQLIANGKAFVLSRLVTDEPTDSAELSYCEFAAAACAAYEYACTEAAAERPVMSENGEVSIRPGSPELIRAMKALRDSAFTLLAAEGLTGAGSVGFSFLAV